MAIRLTVLCENSVGKPGRAVGEHGFACHIATETGRYLFDTGQGIGIGRNALELGIDLARLDGIILSHGHYDHAGGMVEVLSQCGAIDVFAHPGIFCDRYWRSDFEERYIGLPYRRPLLETLGARFRFSRNFGEIAPGLFLSGEIPRVTSFERGDPHLVIPTDDGFAPDPFLDDYSLVIDTPKGLVLLLGCAHAGMVNIIEHVLAKSGRDDLYAVLGGTHLAPANEEQYRGTLEALKRYKVQKIGVAHCTGLQRATQLSQEFSGRFFFASVGATLEI